MSQKLDLDDDVFLLLKIVGLTVFFIVSMFIAFGVGSLIHEGGHARACIALGGNVGGFWHWLRGAWSLAPTTDCSIKPIPPLVWAAGDVTSIVVWFGSVLVAARLLDHALIKRGSLASIVWGWWSGWYVVVLFKEVLHSYSPPSVWEDTTQFVHVTGINPNLVGFPFATILAVSLWLWWRVQYRLLPDLLLSQWDRLRSVLTCK
jgi:hypothetical protein